MNWKLYDYKHSISRNNWVGRIYKGSAYKCPFCGGIGLLPRTKGTKCHVCCGRGELKIAGPVVICAYCKGRGDYPPKTNLTCPVCKGKGRLAVTPPVEKCLDCGGVGKIRGQFMPCKQCRGSGVVQKKEKTDNEN